MKIKMIIIVLILIISSNMPVFAGINMLTNLDNDMVYSGGQVKFGTQAMSAVMIAGTSLEGVNPVGGLFNSFDVKLDKTSVYKVVFKSASPSTFSSKNVQLSTVLETKFKVSLKDPNVAIKPTADYAFVYYVNGVSNWIDVGDSFTPDGTTWVTLKYVINPITHDVKVYKNGTLYKPAYANATIGTGDLTELRFYPRGRPKPAIDGSTEDGVLDLQTQVIWTFDYINIYQITPYGVASADPVDNATNIKVNADHNITFDTAMTNSTVNSANINLQLCNDDGTYESFPCTVSMAGNTATVRAQSDLEYFSKYRITLTPSIKDENSFNLASPKYLYFTTGARSVINSVILDDPAIPLKFSNGGSVGNQLTAGNNKALVSLNNTGTVPKNIRLLAATYTRVNDGVYSYNNCVNKTATLPVGSSLVETGEFAIPNDGKTFVKVYVWDENGYPLVDAISCDVGKTAVIVD